MKKEYIEDILNYIMENSKIESWDYTSCFDFEYSGQYKNFREMERQFKSNNNQMIHRRNEDINIFIVEQPTWTPSTLIFIFVYENQELIGEMLFESRQDSNEEEKEKVKCFSNKIHMVKIETEKRNRQREKKQQAEENRVVSFMKKYKII